MPDNDGQLLPEEKIAILERFKEAFEEWYFEVESPAKVSSKDIFLAGYKAGYGHAKDDMALVIARTRPDPTNPLWGEESEEG